MPSVLSILLTLGIAFAGLILLTAIVTWLVPDTLRYLWRLLLRVVYRFRVYHAERVPQDGPALLVCNHVSYIDWMVIWAACPRRVRFVLWEGYYRHPVLRFFLSWVRHRTVRIDNRTTRPHALVASLQSVADTLNAGEVVLLFAEGRLTRTGQMLPFGRGLEAILERTTADVPVVPVTTHGLWGSIFSHKDGPILRKWPRQFRRAVSVWFGVPLTGRPSAPEVRAAITECQADLAIQESGELPTVVRVFVETATRWRNVMRVGFVDVAGGTERRVTYGQALVGSWCLADWIRTTYPGREPIGIWLPTGLGSALVNIACGLINRPTVNLNYTAGTASVEAAVRQAGLKVVITSRRFTERVPLELPPTVDRVNAEDVIPTFSKLGKLLRMVAVLLVPATVLMRFIGVPRRCGDDIQTLVFSSGSTGEPKGVMLTTRNIAANVDSFRKGVPIYREDVFLATLPFFHSFGYTVCLWASVCIGCRSVYYPDPRAAKEVGELARQHRATVMMGTATFLRFYLRRCDAKDFTTMRLIICGAEKLPVKLAREFQQKFGVLPFEGYGCTELAPVVCTNLPDVTVAGVTQIANEMGTVGQPIPGVVAKAFHLDTMQPLPPGEDGMLCVKGANVMLGYWQQPERTRQVLFDGWYITGDLGRIEPNGFIRITGRMSRFAKLAGEMVPLEKLEEEMQELYGTAERLVAVCAVPDEKRGERLVVLYLPEAAARLEAVLDGLSSRGLPNLWIPDRRDCYPIDAFPVLGSGKLDLKSLGELARKLAGQSQA